MRPTAPPRRARRALESLASLLGLARFLPWTTPPELVEARRRGARPAPTAAERKAMNKAYHGRARRGPLLDAEAHARLHWDNPGRDPGPLLARARRQARAARRAACPPGLRPR